MPEHALPELPARLERLRTRPTAAAREWFRIEAKAGARKAEVSIFDEIGWDGGAAKDFTAKLRQLDADEITLHLNSPGGNFFDGVAIYNSLRDHPATVTTVVEGLAASAASVIAMAGDRVVMNRGSRMMIHNASGGVIGNAKDMRDVAAVLEGIDESMADIYATRSGRSIDEWHTAMRAETWYSAAEAVEAGLADGVAGDAPPTAVAAAEKVTAAAAARRIHAAALKKTPAADLAGGPSTNPRGAAEMQFTDEERTELRARYGLAADAGDDAIKAALLAPPVARTNPPTEPAPAPAPQPTPTPTPGTPAPQPSTPRPTAAGTMTIDASAWEAQQDAIRRLEAAEARRRRDERDQVIAQAVSDGKFAPARKDHWARVWDKDPEGTRQLIAGLTPQVIPTAALGYAGDGADFDFDRELAGFFPPKGA